jgi:hypothetical protein
MGDDPSLGFCCGRAGGIFPGVAFLICCPFLELDPLFAGAWGAFDFPRIEGETTGPRGTSVLRCACAENTVLAKETIVRKTRNHIA